MGCVSAIKDFLVKSKSHIFNPSKQEEQEVAIKLQGATLGGTTRLAGLFPHPVVCSNGLVLPRQSSEVMKVFIPNTKEVEVVEFGDKLKEVIPGYPGFKVTSLDNEYSVEQHIIIPQLFYSFDLIVTTKEIYSYLRENNLINCNSAIIAYYEFDQPENENDPKSLDLQKLRV